jgi:hypothetical protein
MQMSERLFSGVFPCGIGYADTHIEEHGDYKELAFLPFDTLTLEWRAKKMPDELREAITADAARMQQYRGKEFQVSQCGQTVLCGTKVPDAVKSSTFGCRNCLWSGSECTRGSLYQPHMADNVPSCKAYAYYD